MRQCVKRKSGADWGQPESEACKCIAHCKGNDLEQYPRLNSIKIKGVAIKHDECCYSIAKGLRAGIGCLLRTRTLTLHIVWLPISHIKWNSSLFSFQLGGLRRTSFSKLVKSGRLKRLLVSPLVLTLLCTAINISPRTIGNVFRKPWD